MAKPSNINRLADSYKNESSKYDSYGTDPGIISVGSTIIRDVTRKKVSQNDQGFWTETIEVDRNVFESGPESIEKGVVGETKRRIADYNVVLSSLDKKVLSINADINEAKVGIISQIDSARVSHGCSISEFTDSFDTPLKVNGVVVGIGSTLFGDTARYKHYPNLSDPLHDNPFELDRTDVLTLSNVGSGYESINTNNDRVNGSNYGVYQVVNAWLNNQLAGTDTDCQACVDEIKRLAAQIGTLRPQRAIHMKDINLLKKSKLTDEISHWAYQREAQIVKAKQNELLKTVSALSDVTLEVASIQQDGLLFHFDARDSASFDSSRTDWRDLSDNNYHSEVIGEHVSWASTERAFQFNERGFVKGEGMFISGLKYGSGSADQLANLTIESWIKADSTSTGRDSVDHRPILSYDGSEAFRFGLGGTSHQGKPIFEFTNNQGTTNVICTDGDDLRDNKWHQVAVTFASSDTGFDDNPSVSLGIGNTDGTQVSQIKFYVDGQLVQTISDVTETAHNPIGNQITIDTTNPWVRSGPHVGWSTFMNNLAVYPSNIEPLTGVKHTNTWSFDISKDSSNFFLDLQGDDQVTVKFDGVEVTDGTNINNNHISTFNISNLITSNKIGSHTIVGTVQNNTGDEDWDTNPAGIAFRLRDNDDNVIIRSGDSVRYGWIGNGSETSFPGIARTDTGRGMLWYGFIGRIAMYNKTLTETQIEDHFDIYKTDYDLSADIVTIEWISTAFDKSNGGTLSARVKFNVDVDVTGTPQLSVTNGNQGSGSGRGPHLLNFASGSGTSDLVFSLAIGANNAATNASDVLSIAANSVSLNSGSIKNKGTDIIATLSHSTKIGFDAGVIVVSA